MAHFYVDEALVVPAIGDRIVLSGSEARHAVTVSRQSVGESISVGNGAGLVVTGTIESAQPSELVLAVEGVTEVPRREPVIFLAQALAKGDRDELAVQAATELGVDGVIPWQASRSIYKWEGNKIAKGRERWSAIVREASKQSLRAWMPDVLDIVTTRQLAAFASGARMLVLEPTADAALGALELDGRDLILVVGPEGGISPQERDILEDAGAESVRLGVEVLRTSTAGPAALGALNVLLGRW